MKKDMSAFRSLDEEINGLFQKNEKEADSIILDSEKLIDQYYAPGGKIDEQEPKIGIFLCIKD